MRARSLVVAFFGMALAAVGERVQAQRLNGQLLDLETNQPLPAGLVTLLTTDGRALFTVVTDVEGRWSLAVPGAGAYLVSARRLGYSPWVHGPLEIKAAESLTALYHLRRLPLVLDPVEISAQQTERFLSQVGFYDRQRADFGHYITPADIERRQAARITDLLSALPGVRLVDLPGTAGSRAVQLRGSNLSEGGLCRPRIFVDGLLYAHGDAGPRRDDRTDNATERQADEEMQRLEQHMSLDDIGHPSTIAAIEVYRSASQVPAQFGGTSVESLCGVIVVWTRAGSMSARR